MDEQTVIPNRKLKYKTVGFTLMIILQCLIYGVGNPITKIAYESVTPFWCLAFRFTLAFLLIAATTGRKAIAELRSVSPKVWLPAALCMAGAYITGNIALNMASATTIGFLMSLPVLFVPIFARLVLHRPFNWAFLPAQLAAAAGLYLLCSNGGAFSFGWGELLGLIVAVFVAGALVFSEKSLRKLTAMTVSFSQIAVTAAISIAGALIFERGTDLAAIRPVAWWIIVYLSVLCSCLSYLLQNTALAHIPSSLVSLAQCTEPVFTAIASFIVLGETLSGFGWLGAALLIACIVYGNVVETKTTTVMPNFP